MPRKTNQWYLANECFYTEGKATGVEGKRFLSRSRVFTKEQLEELNKEA